ncbi:Cupredoxin [Cordyceps fumosorosea ARSEF 2679]|uniref:Cupredoxin n=1 Tax=Cordyceps fumosorosea (strain ARSEF 2679) TaxID=1081104 RepID=A0A168EJD6_CORFA|nr:Cupredoxin [Cordyceps fumosorosea ARSEF 2679]OAA73881.1 Cupredoxin [Cordyceps fumosorosea ARSEF 2679]
MKWSTTVALAAAPMAAMAANNRLRHTYPVSPKPRAEAVSELDERALVFSNGNGLLNANGPGITVIWVNLGNNAPTSTINQKVTVTSVVTVGGGGEATAPPNAEAGKPTEAPAGEAGTATKSPSAGATHTVKVGGPGGLTFQPDQLNNVPKGDMVVFEFLSQNHTVTQSPFNTPCKKLDQGMDSGFMANPNNTFSPAPKMAMQVTVDTPLWFYCRQQGHCGKGMVFSINPTAEKTQAMFQQMAIAQNGTGEATPITGGTGNPGAEPAAPPAPPAAEAPKESATSKAGETATSSSAGAAEPTAGAGTPAEQPANAEQPKEPVAGGEGTTPGKGTVGADGSCSCFVACNGLPAMGQGSVALGNMAALR